MIRTRRHKTEEEKRRISIATTKAMANPQVIENLKAGMNTPEVKAKLKENAQKTIVKYRKEKPVGYKEAEALRLANLKKAMKISNREHPRIPKGGTRTLQDRMTRMHSHKPHIIRDKEAYRKLHHDLAQKRENETHILINRRRFQSTKETAIERTLRTWLESNNIKFKRGIAVEGRTIPDFFIEPNVCLYADGNYWHSLPHIQTRDKRIRNDLKGKGYLVYSLTETEIKSGIRPTILR